MHKFSSSVVCIASSRVYKNIASIAIFSPITVAKSRTVRILENTSALSSLFFVSKRLYALYARDVEYNFNRLASFKLMIQCSYQDMTPRFLK